VLKVMTKSRSRRTFLKHAAAISAAFPMLNLGSYSAFAGSRKKYSARVMKLMERSIVIDMLGVVKMDFTSAAWSGRLTEQQVQEFRDSGLTVLHQAMGLGDPDAYNSVVSYFASWSGFYARNSEVFLLVDKAADFERAKAAGKVAMILGVQNSEHFRTIDDVKMFHDLGQRCSQLTYNSQNYFGSGSTDRIDGGVSDYGAELIQKMNEVRMLVDVSHCGDKTTLDAMEISKQPIAITHSNCRALNDHPRLKTDEAIKKLAATGGVMGITGVRNFVRDKEPTTIEHMVDHIDHVAKLVGVEHVGIGTDSDLNGSDDMPPEQLKMAKQSYKASYAFRDKIDTDGFDDPLRFYDLTDALVRRGYSDANIEAILGGNFRRLLGQVWGG
jgi:membrane dipeptidase